MRVAAGIVGAVTFGSATYVIAILALGILLLFLQISPMSRFTFMVIVHISMLASVIAGRFGWILFRRDSSIRRIDAARIGMVAAGARVYDRMIARGFSSISGLVALRASPRPKPITFGR